MASDKKWNTNFEQGYAISAPMIAAKIEDTNMQSNTGIPVYSLRIADP